MFRATTRGLHSWLQVPATKNLKALVLTRAFLVYKAPVSRSYESLSQSWGAGVFWFEIQAELRHHIPQVFIRSTCLPVSLIDTDCTDL